MAVTEAGFQQRIARIVARAARAAQVVDPRLGPASEPDADPAPAPRSARERHLQETVGLDDDALDFLWTLVARAVDPRMGAYLRAVWGNDARGGTSLAHHLALAPLGDAAQTALLAVLDPAHPLRALGLATLIDDVADVGARWTVPQRVWRYFAGDDSLDPELARVGGELSAPAFCLLSTAQGAVVDALAEWLTSSDPTTIILDGPLGVGRRTAIAIASKRPVIAIDAARTSPAMLPNVLLALRREVALRGAVPVVANLDDVWSALPQRDPHILAAAAVLDQFTGPLAITCAQAGLEFPTQYRPTLRQTMPLPDIATRRSLWERCAGDIAPAELDALAMRYALGAGGIAAAVAAATQRTPGTATPTFTAICAGVQDNIAERLGELAKRVTVTQRWDELVLPPETLDDVRLLLARVRHAHNVLEVWNFKQKLARGTGVAALFSGPPGTGKTMVAGLIARELGLELYQVDLSRIVSKWVGETEKQLSRLFEAAEAGHALLLFDEADSLFAKRSAEVKSAVDRYANLEVNYLLQRVESFGGVVVLTTNLETSIDPALKRRLASHIVFGVPEREEQLRLWQSMLSTGAPLASDLQLQDLVKEFAEMTGAHIRNAVLGAAFLASDEGTPIGMKHLRRAARGEYRAMGHVLGQDHHRL